MKWIVICAATPAVVAGGMYLHHPAGVSETYPRSATETQWVLETLQVPPAVQGMLNSVPQSSITRDEQPGKSASWFFNARGAQAAKFVVEMAPVDAGHTRVTTSFTMSDGADALLKAEFMPLAKQFASVAPAAMQEQLDAQMEQRAFDKRVVGQAMAGYAMANMGEIQQSASAVMDQAAAKFREQDAEEAVRKSGITFQPGQPMMDPKANQSAP